MIKQMEFHFNPSHWNRLFCRGRSNCLVLLLLFRYLKYGRWLNHIQLCLRLDIGFGRSSCTQLHKIVLFQLEIIRNNTHATESLDHLYDDGKLWSLKVHFVLSVLCLDNLCQLLDDIVALNFIVVPSIEHDRISLGLATEKVFIKQTFSCGHDIHQIRPTNDLNRQKA